MLTKITFGVVSILALLALSAQASAQALDTAQPGITCVEDAGLDNSEYDLTKITFGNGLGVMSVGCPLGPVHYPSTWEDAEDSVTVRVYQAGSGIYGMICYTYTQWQGLFDSGAGDSTSTSVGWDTLYLDIDVESYSEFPS